MPRIPVIGPKQAHTVQLSPKLRKILHERAAAANRREYAPVLAADRAAIQVPQKQYETQVGAAKGAASAIETSLAGALAGLKESGLKGAALQDAIAGLTARQGEALQALPYAYAGAAEERSKGQLEARQALAQDRAALLQGIGSSFNNLLESARSTGSQALKEKEERERSHRQEVAANERQHEADVRENHREAARDRYGAGGSAEVSDNVQSAYQVALSGYKFLLAHQGEAIKDKTGQVVGEFHAPKTAAEWSEFVAHTADESGQGSYQDALEAVEALRKQLARLRHQGKLPTQGSEATHE